MQQFQLQKQVANTHTPKITPFVKKPQHNGNTGVCASRLWLVCLLKASAGRHGFLSLRPMRKLPLSERRAELLHGGVLPVKTCKSNSLRGAAASPLPPPCFYRAYKTLWPPGFLQHVDGSGERSFHMAITFRPALQYPTPFLL